VVLRRVVISMQIEIDSDVAASQRSRACNMVMK
jgi:hypothetical protein